MVQIPGEQNKVTDGENGSSYRGNQKTAADWQAESIEFSASMCSVTAESFKRYG